MIWKRKDDNVPKGWIHCLIEDEKGEGGEVYIEWF